MKIYSTKPETARMSQWLGGKDEEIVQELKDLGFGVFFQQPPVETEKDWDDKTGEEVEVPSQARMVVVGPYNWDTFHFTPGRYVVFSLVNKKTGEPVEWSDETLADENNKVALHDRMQSTVDNKYDLVG